MYKGWKIERWETPVSDAKSLAMVYLHDDEELVIVVQDLRDKQKRRFEFTFTQCPAYRNIREDYRLELWKRLSKGFSGEIRHKLGWTLLVPNSQWISQLSCYEPLLLFNNPDIHHYIICTEDDVIEILSAHPPQIHEIDPAPHGVPLPGKSIIYYDPEDRKEIEKVIKRFQRGVRKFPQRKSPKS